MSGIYIPLHCHSDYSIGDALMSIDEYVEWLKTNKIEAAALTDHGNMCGAMYFNQKCLAAGIKPIMGLEAYCQFRGEFESEEKVDTDLNDRDHFLLLAKNRKGYNALLKLVGKSMREGFYKKPIIFYEDIISSKGDIIASAACMSGRAQQLIIKDKYEDAEKFIMEMKNGMGDDFYLECMENDMDEQRKINKWFLEQHERLGVKVIWTTDTHYLLPEHNVPHDVLKLNLAKLSFSDITPQKKLIYTARNLFLKGYNEVKKEALENGIKEDKIEMMICNTKEIADKCEKYPLKSKEIFMPKFSDNSYRELAQKALDSLKAKKINRMVYVERLKHELAVIKSKKMEDYFLIVADICDFARKNDIMVGIGRGSGAGSLVVWLLGITGVDPIKYNLIFARFLNEQRHDPPDIDLDFDSRNRYKIEEYLKIKYGAESVGHIVSFGRFGVKGALRDTFRAYYKTKMSAELEECTKNIADDDEEFEETIKKSILLGGAQVQQFVNRHRDKFDIAKVLVGKNRHYSLHAGGVVISNGPLENYIPVMHIKDSIAAGLPEGGDTRLITDAGLMKFDILGLNACAIIKDAIKNTEGKCSMDKILEDDNNKIVLGEFQKGNTFGCFQFEGKNITNYVVRVFPTAFEDLVAINALYRPAVIVAGGLDRFVENRRIFNRDTTDPFELILKDTYGVVAYQEQMMQVFHKLGGFTLEESDEARHTLKLLFKGKDDLSEFNTMLAKFREGCKKTTTYDDDKINKVMEIVKEFSQYSFNRSHSLSYAMMGYAMMYLKVFHPLEFFSALLTNTENCDSFQDKIKTNMLRSYIVKIHKTSDIQILPPDILKSDKEKFTIEGKNLRFPLSQVKGVGGAAEMIIDRRPYASLKEMLEKVEKRKVNKRVIKALIRSGAITFSDIAETYKKQYKEEVRTSIYGVYETTNVLFGQMFKEQIKEPVFSLRDVEHRACDGLPIGAFLYKLRPTITKKGNKINFVSLYDGTTILDSCIISDKEMAGLKEGQIITAKAYKKKSANQKYTSNVFNLHEIKILENPESAEKEEEFANFQTSAI
jgi:DNA polymerase-3 subunit alpha